MNQAPLYYWIMVREHIRRAKDSGAPRVIRLIYRDVQRLTGVAMDFSDVPNVLCETDKMIRTRLGEGTPRSLYVEGRGY